MILLVFEFFIPASGDETIQINLASGKKIFEK